MPAKASAADAVVPDPVPEAPQAEPVAPQPADPAPQEAESAETASEWGNWRYLGPSDRVYTNVPVTPEPGDVVTWLGPPATDGCWESTSGEVTRHPDNHRPEPQPTDTPEEG